jgi:hypothetical protein
MKRLAITELAESKGALSAALKEHKFVELAETGEEPAAVAMRPEDFAVLLAMVEDLGASAAHSGANPPAIGQTVSARELISQLR